MLFFILTQNFSLSAAWVPLTVPQSSVNVPEITGK